MKLLIVYSLLFVVICNHCTSAVPINDETNSKDETSETSTENATFPQDLYVIRSVVYEVGILTDASNDTDNLNQTQEQVDLSFFNPTHNGSLIDLSNIPVPIETNVSGVSVTGLLPYSLGSLPLPNGTHQLNLTSPLLPQKQLTVTQNISTHNPDQASQIIDNLPKLFHLKKVNKEKSAESDEKSDESGEKSHESDE